MKPIYVKQFLISALATLGLMVAFIHGPRLRPLQADEMNQFEESRRAQSAHRDIELQKAVENRLGMDPKINSTSMRITARSGVVTLDGTVDNVMDKEQARRYAQGVRGVQMVNDNLVVKNVQQTDGEIRDEIKRVLTINPSVNASNVQVDVENSVVSLNGTVASQKEKEHAEQAAKNVDGVKKVVNYLQITQEPGQPRHIDQQ